jgi:hypothetical protein
MDLSQTNETGYQNDAMPAGDIEHVLTQQRDGNMVRESG